MTDPIAHTTSPKPSPSGPVEDVLLHPDIVALFHHEKKAAIQPKSLLAGLTENVEDAENDAAWNVVKAVMAQVAHEDLSVDQASLEQPSRDTELPLRLLEEVSAYFDEAEPYHEPETVEALRLEATLAENDDAALYFEHCFQLRQLLWRYTAQQCATVPEYWHELSTQLNLEELTAATTANTQPELRQIHAAGGGSHPALAAQNGTNRPSRRRRHHWQTIGLSVGLSTAAAVSLMWLAQLNIFGLSGNIAGLSAMNPIQQNNPLLNQNSVVQAEFSAHSQNSTRMPRWLEEPMPAKPSAEEYLLYTTRNSVPNDELEVLIGPSTMF